MTKPPLFGYDKRYEEWLFDDDNKIDIIGNEHYDNDVMTSDDLMK